MKKICLLIAMLCMLCGCADNNAPVENPVDSAPDLGYPVPSALVGTYAKWDIEMDTNDPMLMSVNMGIVSVDKLVVTEGSYLVYENYEQFILNKENNRLTLYVGDVNQIEDNQDVNYCVSGENSVAFMTKLYEVNNWDTNELKMFLETCQADMEIQPYVFFTLEEGVDLSEWK